ncbi:MAG: hypothetical protein AUH28_10275 [Acidobacteria bacterium 13_1_40CM_56_16]|nr:MAG: hypothetical protein AUH28_10275 [Acidobacteria bacterium 13_1_40CM_56_16]OLD71574.1 MAG: hypothetical protein AUI45_01235 [Acidobacteria bacterium 13_1_40CM_2_56_11]
MNLQIVPGIRQPNSVHKSEAREVNSLSSVLSRALHNEPQLLYLIPDEQTRRAVSPWFFQTAIQVSRIWGEIYTTDTADGVALWMSPEHNWTIGRIVRTGIIGIPFDLQSQIQISRRFLKLCTSLAKARRQLAPLSHWYLMILGVESEHEEAVGGALIEPVLSRADSTGMPCYLETFNEKRLGFYKNHGFRIAGAGKIPGGGPSFWAMTRAAKIRSG